MPSQSCLQPSWNPHQLPHGWGHRGGPAVPSPSTKAPPTAAVPGVGAVEEKAAGLVAGNPGARVCVHELREQARRSQEDMLVS